MALFINQLAGYLDKASYGFLALNFLFGLYCVILIWRRLVELRFRRQEAEAEFIEQLQDCLLNAATTTRPPRSATTTTAPCRGCAC